MGFRARRFVIAALAALLLGGIPAAHAAPIIYVDPGDHSVDYQGQLTLLGYAFTTFNAYNNAEWATALGAADVILVGERHLIGTNTSAATKAGLAAFVSGGGGFIGHTTFSNSSNDMSAFMNSVFGTALSATTVGCSSADTDVLNVAAAAGTPYAGGPVTLDDPSCTGSVSTASVVGSGMSSIYNDLSGNTSVAADVFGSGGFAYLGWDFCVGCASAADTAAWRDVLNRSIQFVDAGATPAVPEPGPLLLLGSGLAGVVWDRMRRRRQA